MEITIDDSICRSQETRERILSAALHLFSKNGFHASTTRAISRVADVNEVTLFRLFNNKSELFRSVLNRAKKIQFDLKPIEEIRSIPEKVIQYIAVKTLEVMENHPKEFRLMHYAIVDEVEEFEEEFIKDFQSKIQLYLEEAFAALQKVKKLTSELHPKMLTHIFQCTLMGMTSSRILSRTFPVKQLEREEIGQGIVELFWGQ